MESKWKILTFPHVQYVKNLLQLKLMSLRPSLKLIVHLNSQEESGLILKDTNGGSAIQFLTKIGTKV